MVEQLLLDAYVPNDLAQITRARPVTPDQAANRATSARFHRHHGSDGLCVLPSRRGSACSTPSSMRRAHLDNMMAGESYYGAV